MSKIPLHTVRYLTLSEIAAMWAEEVDTLESIMLRELRLGVLNIKRLEEGQEMLDVLPPEKDLPDPSEPVDQLWLAEFLKKQDGWYEPKFWRHREQVQSKLPGRPSLKETVIQIFDERKANGETASGITAECREIISILDNMQLEEKIPQGEAVRQMIHSRYYSGSSKS